MHHARICRISLQNNYYKCLKDNTCGDFQLVSLHFEFASRLAATTGWRLVFPAGLAKAARERRLGMRRWGGCRDPKLSG